MSFIVPRTCTEIPEDAGQESPPRSRSPAEFRQAPSYVLLGDPGSGKTTSFEAECRALGEEACLVAARDFLTLDPDAHPEWHGTTLFIDGLDEVRGGGGDARTPLDTLRGRLEALGRPRFRLSCREADWLGANDRRNLAAVAPEAGLAVLRLDPLTEEDIERFLNSRTGVGDASAFVATAKEQGVAGFLANPQCLHMLADVVAGGDAWPQSRLDLMEGACRRMVREHNEEHIAATGRRSSSPGLVEDDLLDAAGRLCAVLLMSGLPGSAVPGRESADYPDLNRCAGQQEETCRRAVSTKLFKAAAGGRFQPIHRYVAEFLAGRYLARLIEGDRRGGRVVRGGIPARRVVALMAGHDGGVVTELRGLSAWIAAHTPSARDELIERDPIGVGLYGDIGRFSTREKRDLLTSLARVASRLHLASGAIAAFESLATAPMEPAIEEILGSTGREPERESFVGFVLDVVCNGSALSGLADRLLALVHDDTWSPWIRAAAVRAFLHNSPDGPAKTNMLKLLLEDIQAGAVADPDQELRGILLSRLYPREVPPSQVWSYWGATASEALLGSWRLFWLDQLPAKSTDAEAVQLVNGLARWVSEATTAPDLLDNDARETATRLLARALAFRGDAIDVPRLYGWLRVGAQVRRDDLHEHYASVRTIRLWLEQRPEVQKAVLMEGLRRCDVGESFWRQAFDVHECLYGAHRAADYGFWCLKQAVSLADTKLQLAEYLLWEAFRSHKSGDGDEGLSLDVLTAHVRRCDKLKAGWEWVTRPPERSEDTEERRRYAAEQHQQEEKWLAEVRSNLVALSENRAAPAMLFRMARAYFGDVGRRGVDVGPGNVEKLLGGNRDLTRAALTGLRGAMERPDVPEIDEVLDLRKRNRMPFLAWPFLAGMAEAERTSPKSASAWDEGRMRKALVFYHLTPHADYSPEWYRRIVEERPELVADALVRIAVSGFRLDGSDSPVLWLLAHDRSHTRVAQLASLRLLDRFPTRCNAKQLRSLDLLLRAVLQHAGRARLLELVDRRLRRRSMNDSQRVRWLACGALVAPINYDARLREFAEGRERRVRHLMEFLFGEDGAPTWRPPLGERGLKLFIRLLAPYSDPDSWSEAGVVTPPMWATRHVSRMITKLAALPGEDVSETLEGMAGDATLLPWRPALLQAMDDQRVVRRDAVYRHPGFEAVCRTLDDKAPASPADLAALTGDRLNEIARAIRSDNANGWRPFWNEDEHRRADTPKHEESCRDALLKELRHWLPDDVDVQPEGRYANDKRADLRLAHCDFHVPVEIKRNGHRRLWSALQDQLIAQYTRDPATGGYGIYLVLWFGEIDGCRTPPPATGKRPTGPDALRQVLREDLTPEDARKISVCVVDVSAPPTKAR